MKITEYLERAPDRDGKTPGSKKTLFSFEILPPLKGQNLEDLLTGIEPLMEFKPPFVDVTYHRNDYIYKENKDGQMERISIRKRPGTIGICVALMNRFHVEAVPHLLCGGFTKEDTENALIDFNFIGIRNILALRGDPPKSEKEFRAEPGGHRYASELVRQISDLNAGKYLHEHTETGFQTDFCIGVAGYPEKHFEAPDMAFDLQMLKEKVDAGAEYIVTQMFFDNSKFFEFVKNVREMGITVPIIPGLKPVTTLREIEVLPEIFHLTFPEELMKELKKCKTHAEAKDTGVEWAIHQSRELIAAGAPVLHYYTISKADATYRIAQQVF